MENAENKKSKKKILPFILGTIILAALVIGIRKYTFALNHEDTEDAQVEGSISSVLPRVSGYVKEINFEDNQKVTKGQVLLTLDDRELRIKVAQAEAALENVKASESATRATVSSVSSGTATAQANIEAANARVWKATQDFNRFKNLLDEKAITQQQFDAVKAEKEIAEAQLEVARKQLASAQSQAGASSEQVPVVQSLIKQKESDLDFAKLQLSYATIAAPVSGIVSKKNVQPGQFVQAGQPLFAVVSDSDIWVTANFKETQLEQIKIGQSVDISVDAFKDKELKGEVSSFSPATGAKFSLLPPDNATGNFVKVVQRIPVKIKLKADKSMISSLRPGMSVHVTVNTD